MIRWTPGITGRVGVALFRKPSLSVVPYGQRFRLGKVPLDRLVEIEAPGAPVSLVALLRESLGDRPFAWLTIFRPARKLLLRLASRAPPRGAFRPELRGGFSLQRQELALSGSE